MIMKQEMSYKDLLCEKGFLKLFFANLISRFGDSIDMIAISWMAYELTDSATWLAIIFGVNMIPNIIFQPFCGVLVERMNRKTVLILTDFGRGLIVLLIALLYFFSLLSPWFLLVCMFLISTLESFRIPAGLSVFPQLLPKEKYSYGSGLSSSVSTIVQMVGLASAGFIISLLGLSGAILIDAMTFILSGIILLSLSIKPISIDQVSLSFASFIQDAKEGLHYFISKKVILWIGLLAGVLNLLLIPFNTLQAAYIQDSLHLGPEGLSLSSFCLMGGLALGSLAFPLFQKKFKKHTLFVLGGLTFSIIYILLAFLPLFTSTLLVYTFLICLSFIAGFGASFVTMPIQIGFMEHVEEAYLSRIGGVFNCMASLPAPIGSFAIGSILLYLSVDQLFLYFGLGCMIFFITMCFNKIIKQL